MVKSNVELSGKTVIVTGAAGFIGAALSKRLLDEYNLKTLVGVDSLNSYYSPELKKSRLAELEKNDNFIFEKGNIADMAFLQSVFENTRLMFL